MKWRNVELKGNDAEEFTRYLKANGYRYEPSAAGFGYTHFEVYVTDEEAERLNAFLDTF